MTPVGEAEHWRRRLFPAIVAVAALIALLTLAPLASAARDPLSSGTTKFTLDSSFTRSLKRHRVRLAGVSPTTLSDSTVALRVDGGFLDPTTGAGTIRHSGGLAFRAGARSAAIVNLEFDTSARSLVGKLGGRNLKLATLTGVSFVRDGFGADVTVVGMKLTSTAARVLNAALTPARARSRPAAVSSPFRTGEKLGSAFSATQPASVTILPGGDASLQTEASSELRLLEAGVGFAPIAPGTESASMPPLFGFPIAGGTISPAATAGRVETTGGVRLAQKEEEVSAGVKAQLSVILNNIWVELATGQASAEINIESSNQAEVRAPGALGRNPIASIDLSAATIVSDPIAHTVSISGAKVTLQTVTAAKLNEVFGRAAGKPEQFAAGEPLGFFSFTVQTQ
jgi:hypothetical protein